MNLYNIRFQILSTELSLHRFGYYFDMYLFKCFNSYKALIYSVLSVPGEVKSRIAIYNTMVFHLLNKPNIPWNSFEVRY